MGCTRATTRTTFPSVWCAPHNFGTSSYAAVWVWCVHVYRWFNVYELFVCYEHSSKRTAYTTRVHNKHAFSINMWQVLRVFFSNCGCLSHYTTHSVTMYALIPPQRQKHISMTELLVGVQAVDLQIYRTRVHTLGQNRTHNRVETDWIFSACCGRLNANCACTIVPHQKSPSWAMHTVCGCVAGIDV